MFNEVKKQVEWNGETLELSTGKIARQADGAVMVRMGDSAVLCTVVSARSVKEGANFFPLTVNYQEKAYAAGKIPGGFFKREARATENEILVSRLIDRPIRPLFHPGFFNETQVICTVHSHDPKHNTDILALIGASAALAIAGVPYLDIVAAGRVGYINDEYVLNPSAEMLEDSKLDLVVAGTKDSVMMVESEAEFLTEKQMLDAVKFGHESFQPVIKLIQELKKEAGKPAWEQAEFFPSTLKEEIAKLTGKQVKEAFAIKDKRERYAAVKEISDAMYEKFVETEEYTGLQVDFALSEVKAEILRADTLSKEIRIDNRKPDEVRPIECEVKIFPKVHGSSLFTRGETQGLVSTTLGTGQDQQIMESLNGEYKESFLLNYLFPPYSVGEVQQLRAPSRRETGHGKLAWRALKRALPEQKDFPYTIRVVSEITESNGSSSMATVCGASMSMMDAGVPLKAPIAGIAMGLIKEGNEFMVLSDIIADEDHLGDMDFKVAGSKDGVTALQMDIKVAGINFDIMAKALDQAKDGRVHILGKMNNAIDANGKLSDNAPAINSFTIDKGKIRDVIGPGGKIIREICDITGAKIDINDEGEVVVAAVGQDNLNEAVQRVKDIAIDPEMGSMVEVVVAKVIDAGAFVDVRGGRSGFIHISEISHERVESVGSVLSEGQKLEVKLIGFDRGRMQFTIKGINEDLPTAGDKKRKPERKKISGKKPEKEKRAKDKNWQNNKESGKEKTDSDVKERKYFN